MIIVGLMYNKQEENEAYCIANMVILGNRIRYLARISNE